MGISRIADAISFPAVHMMRSLSSAMLAFLFWYYKSLRK